MGYRLERGESVRTGVLRVVTEQLDGAVAKLTATGGDRVEAVHGARKHVKKARSALRLVRGELAAKTYRKENDRLRAAARELSGPRDAQVAVTALDRLRAADEGDVAPRVWARVREVLDDRRQAAGEAVLGQGGTAAAVAERLAAARDRLARLDLDRGGWKALRGGLGREYARGLDARAAAGRKPTADNLHAWRRRVKDGWYHTRLLESVWPAPMEQVAAEAQRLSELLGDDHDLANLRATLTGDAGALGVDLDGLLAILDARRWALQAEALLLGDRLYAEAPKAYVARLGTYWRAWRAEDAVERRGGAHGNGGGGRGDGRIAEPRLTATAGTVEPTVPPAPRPARPTAPLLPPPALGSIERPAFRTAPPPRPSAPTLPPPAITTPARTAPAPVAGAGAPEDAGASAGDGAAAELPVAAVPAAAGGGAVTVAALVDEDLVHAATGGKRYHRQGCRMAGPTTRPLSREAAAAAGLSPCGTCRP